MYDQMYEYFNKIILKQQCGFRQGFSTQHCLLAMTEQWRKYLDKNGVNGALLTDLSKAFDCLLHDLLIAKLAAYGFDYEFSTLIQSYLSNRKQRTKVNNTYSTFLTLYSEFLKVQYYTLSFLISIFAICFMTILTVISQAMQMTIRPTAVAFHH